MTTTETTSDFVTAKDVEDIYGIDLVTAETIRSGLIESTRHMFRTTVRSAFSNVVRDLLDTCSCIHLPGDDGLEMVAATEGCVHFAFTHPHMANLVMDEWGLHNIGPGDTIISNDPWRGAVHLPDVSLFRPVFWEGEPIFLLSNGSHLLDIGGPVPGGFNNQATDFFSEGIRIPPTLITSGDEPVRSTINLILENTRTPQQNLGDLRALFGAMRVGEGRLVKLLERYGPEAVKAGSRYALDLAERRIRAAISRVPDGIYEGEEWIDDDGLGSDPLRIHATAKVAGSEVEIDFSGTDAQPLGSLTSCWEETSRIMIGAKLLLDPDHPMNAGMMRAFQVLAPPGSVLMGVPPTSNSQHSEVGTSIAMLSVKLVGQMVPERAMASDGCCSNACVVGGIDSRPGREGQPVGGIIAAGMGWGGSATQDGISFCGSPIYGTSSSIIEFMERDAPVVLRSTNAQIDSAGFGKHRAGFASTVLLECLSGELAISMLFDSGRFPRWSLNGGGEGMTSYIFRVERDADGMIPQSAGLVPLERLTPLAGIFDADGNPDPTNGEWGLGAEFMTNKVTGYMLRAGEALLMFCGSGGGYGDPLERDPDAVRDDVWNEHVSLGAARDVHGVVLDPATLDLDADATAALRERLRSERGGEVRISGYQPWPRTADDLPRTASLAAAGDQQTT